MKRIYFILFLGILLLAFLLRFKLFAFGDFYFFQDQSRDLLLAKEIAENGKIILIGARTGFGGLFHGPLWIFLLVPTYILSHGNPLQTLVPIFLLVSVGIVFSGFVIGWKLYGKVIGLLFAFFLAISLPLNEAIYFTTNAHAMPLAFLFYLYFIIRYLRGSDKSFVVAMFLIGVGFHLEGAFAFSLIPLTLIALLYRRKNQIKIILGGALAFLISVSNFILFDLRHNFLMTHSVLRLFKGGGGALPGYEQYTSIAFRIHDRFLGLLNSFASPAYSSGFLINVLLAGVFIFAFLLIIKSWYKSKKLNSDNKEFLFILLSPLLAYLLYVLYPYPLWGHYTLSLSIPAILLLCLSIKNISKNKFGLILSCVLILLAIIPALSSLNDYYIKTSNHDLSSDSSYKNQMLVVNWTLKDSGSSPFNYLVYIPSTFTYGMDYLFSWDKLTEGRRIIPCSKNGLTYLIFYPHEKGDNNAYTYWKENVIKTKQKPIITKQFPGGILVEKLNIKDKEIGIDPNYCQNLTFR